MIMSFRFYVIFVIFLILCFIIFSVLHQLLRDERNIMVYYLFPKWFDFCCFCFVFCCCFLFYFCFFRGWRRICSVLTSRLSSSGLWVIFWTLVKLVGYYRMEAFRNKDCHLTPQLVYKISYVCWNICYKI